MTEQELRTLLHSDESYRIERTVSTGDMDKFQEAICAFANDLPGSGKHGYLLIGVDDKGTISGLKVDDALMKRIAAIRSDGNILPLPIMSTEKVETAEGDVLVVDVSPSFDTPVRYRGRTFVRIGPRRDIANRDEERVLSERCAAALPSFDTRPCRGATLADIDTDTIVSDYMPNAVDADTLANDRRPLEEQLAALHLYNLQWNCPTYAAIIMFGNRPEYFLPGCYLQYVRFQGQNAGGTILNERRFSGSLYTILPLLENFIRDAIITKRPVPISILREKDVYNYPYKALRELLMNAVMHRDYQSNTPIRIYQFDDHIEITNAGGLYGQARPENFPYINDYRNPVLAEIMRLFNYVNKFNHGIQEVKTLLSQNGNAEAVFNVNYVTAFQVLIEDANISDAKVEERAAERLSKEGNSTITQPDAIGQVSGQATGQATGQVQKVVLAIGRDRKTRAELMKKLKLKGRDNFRKAYLTPSVKAGYVKLLYPLSETHPEQAYYLSAEGLQLLQQLSKRK